MIKIWIELGFKDVVNKAGAKMAASSVNFPSLFGVMPRDIARYCNTQYRLFELAIWIRFFSIPCLRDAGLPKVSLPRSIFSKKSHSESGPLDLGASRSLGDLCSPLLYRHWNQDGQGCRSDQS